MITKYADQLSMACRDGDLQQAYRIVANIPQKYHMELMLRAGFKIHPTKDKKKNMEMIQGAIAGAARNKVDGRGYAKIAADRWVQ